MRRVLVVLLIGVFWMGCTWNVHQQPPAPEPEPTPAPTPAPKPKPRPKKKKRIVARIVVPSKKRPIRKVTPGPTPERKTPPPASDIRLAGRLPVLPPATLMGEEPRNISKSKGHLKHLGRGFRYTDVYSYRSFVVRISRFESKAAAISAFKKMGKLHRKRKCQGFSFDKDVPFTMRHVLDDCQKVPKSWAEFVMGKSIVQVQPKLTRADRRKKGLAKRKARAIVKAMMKKRPGKKAPKPHKKPPRNPPRKPKAKKVKIRR